MASNYEEGTRISEYVLEACVGRGAFSEVWRGRHHIWEKDRVAIKLPTEPEYVRYLRREGTMVHGLKHANIVRVLGLDPYAEIPYMVMELVEGPSLRGAIDDHPNGLPIHAVVVILRAILDAMSTAHDANVLHRDLKPGNVLLHLDGESLENLRPDQVKVSDFGLGLVQLDTIQSMAQSVSMDRDGKLVGTLAYMAPELRDKKGEADARSDLYSIGVMLFEMLTGERPAGAELPGTYRAETPPVLDDMFRRFYSRRDRRYASAAEALADLDVQPQVPPVPLPGIPPIPTAGRCRSCGIAVGQDDQYCTKCGDQLVAQVQRCASCGAYPGADDRFCIHCGAQVASRSV